MSDITLDTTLAEIVNTTPGSARILESFGLDYCCGGRQRLGLATSARGVDPTEVLASLGVLEATCEPDWMSMTPVELVDHIESTHHVYLHSELERLETLMDKVVGVHGGRHPELSDVQATYRALRADLEPHLVKEERVLFPMIRELATTAQRPEPHYGSLRNPISRMMVEHERAGELLATLRSQTDGHRPPADGCASYRALFQGLAEIEADTHLHVHKENNVLFPAVVRLEARRQADTVETGHTADTVDTEPITAS